MKNKNIFSKEELSELESIVLRGGQTRVTPITQTECSNNGCTNQGCVLNPCIGGTTDIGCTNNGCTIYKPFENCGVTMYNTPQCKGM